MQSKGHLTLIDADGSLWHGSAQLGAASVTESTADSAVTPLLPGRFSWQLSPWLLPLGRIDLQLANTESLSRPVHVSGTWQQWHLGAGSLLLPAERLAALGAPLNTLAPSGRMRLVWNDLNAEMNNGVLQLHGDTTLELDDMGSRLSPVNPLGSYRMKMTWQGTQAPLTLTSLHGPLLLQGNGTVLGAIGNGKLQFSGSAEASAGQEEKLANLLNLLGRRRQQDGRNIIALEFK